MSKHQKRLWLILVLAALALVIDFPKNLRLFNQTFSSPQIHWQLGNYRFDRDLKPKLGLDLSGGTRLTLVAQLNQIDPDLRSSALDSSREVISRRVDLFGVAEPNIYTQQTATDQQIIVELPGVTDPQQAIELLGKTAQLEFRTPVYSQETPTVSPEGTPSGKPQIIDFAPTDLTGAHLQKASVTFDSSQAAPSVSLEFNPEGTQLFADLTRDYLDQPIAIFLDEQLLTAPVVQSTITTGQAVITGSFTLEEAKNLEVQLNAGALPVPISVASQENIAPTLGADSIRLSLRAGLVGLSLVILFMISNYGTLGLLASLSLGIYGLITLALYKLIPITLTLPGIAGFILSVGMAVDSNILIFERFKEELRAGRPWMVALELGFGRAWDSIKDANIATLITAFILFNPLHWSFLPTSGPVRGFALTLTLGVLISLFTGIFVTRTLLRVVYSQKSISPST